MSRPRVCSVVGCDRPRHARELCTAHAYRLKRHGDVMADKPIGWRFEIVHGTYDGYANHGCRCAPCTKANTDYMRARNHRRGIHKPREEHLAAIRAEAEARDNHGTETRYALGCRCAECRAGVAAMRRMRRARVAA